MRSGGWAVAIPMIFVASMAKAGAWPQVKNHGQVIVTQEVATAQFGYNDEGLRERLIGSWRSSTLSFYGEAGLTNTQTLTYKLNYQDHELAGRRFKGIGSLELGLRHRLLEHQHKSGDVSQLAVAINIEGLGQGLRNEFDTEAKAHKPDLEVRAFYGRSFKLKAKSAFVDIQLAHRFRVKEPDQMRFDLTLGTHLSPRTIWLNQIFAGQLIRESKSGQRPLYARWMHQQTSLVFKLKETSRTSWQIGYRRTLGGVNIPEVNGVFVGLWAHY